MYFTLMFVTPGEGPARTYDLVFHPCPVWMRGDKEIIIPNSENPRYELGSLDMLFKRENIEEEMNTSNPTSAPTNSNVSMDPVMDTLRQRYGDDPVMGSSKALSPNVFVFVHWAGNGHDGDLGKLLEDLENNGWNPIVLNAEEGKIFFFSDGRYGLSE